MTITEKVLVSGFFDVLHIGHVDFLEKAAALGRLHVCVGTDENFRNLKGSDPISNEKDRLRLVAALSCVDHAFVSKGSGLLDFEADLKQVRPDKFVVNVDGHSQSKKNLCCGFGIEYIVLDDHQTPSYNISLQMDENSDPLRVPYRLCLAGGWMDQPWVSSATGGDVVVVRIQPTREFCHRAGMATSTRDTARRIWGEHIPSGNPHHVAKTLFGAENPPGTKYVSGSQDAIGLVFPGVTKLHYNGGYWPAEITSVIDESIAKWLEEVIHLVPVGPRPLGYDPLIEKHLDCQLIKKLSLAGELCWQAISRKDTAMLGESMNQTLQAWQAILPNTVPERLYEDLDRYKCSYGRVLSGCGGGFIIVVSDMEIEGALKIKVCNE